MQLDSHELGLRVEMVNTSHFNATSSSAECNVRRTSLSLPLVVPDRAFRTFDFDCTFVFVMSVWCLKDSRLSNFIPRNLGLLTMGTCSPLMVIGRSVESSLL